jgi:hypothetical protein
MILPSNLKSRWEHSVLNRVSTKILLLPLLLLLLLLAPTAVFSQCENSIKINKVSVDKESNKGSIEVEVSTTKEFVCTLNIQKGSGPSLVERQNGNKSAIVRFQNLDANKVYMVEVEFVSEPTQHCKKLQKSLITFQ